MGHSFQTVIISLLLLFLVNLSYGEVGLIYEEELDLILDTASTQIDTTSLEESSDTLFIKDSTSTQDDSMRSTVSVTDTVLEAGADTIMQELIFSSKSNYYLNRAKSLTDLHYLREDSNSILEQKVNYDTEYSKEVLSLRHQLSLPGEYRHRFPLLNDHYIGFEWLPELYGNHDYDTILANSYGIGSISIGPLMKGKLLHHPYRVSAGYGVDVWNDSMANNWFKSRNNHNQFDNGGYFSFQMGDMGNSLFGDIPLYGMGTINGRYMSRNVNSRVTEGNITLLFQQEEYLGADTFQMLFTDTLVHGRVGNIYRSSESIPNRVNNSMGLQTYMTNLGEWWLEPSLGISLMESYYYYPQDDTAQYTSFRERTLIPSISLNKTLTSWLFLETNLEVGWTSEENLFDYDDKVINKNVRLQNEKLQDLLRFKPKLLFTTILSPLKYWSLKYQFEVERNRKEYPWSYNNGGELIKSSNASDDQSMTHRSELFFVPAHPYSLNILFEYFRNSFNLLDSLKSSNSKLNERFKIELLNSWVLEDAYSHLFTVGGVVQPQRFRFSDMAAVQPAHKRELYVKSDGRQMFTSSLGLLYGGLFLYQDNGFWYEDDYYGITSKNWEYGASLGGILLFSDYGDIRMGVDGKKLESFVWSEEDDDYQFLGDSYFFEPYMSVGMVLPKQISVKGKIKKYIDKGIDNGRDYWDIGLTVTKGL